MGYVGIAYLRSAIVRIFDIPFSVLVRLASIFYGRSLASRMEHVIVGLRC